MLTIYLYKLGELDAINKAYDKLAWTIGLYLAWRACCHMGL